MSIVFDKTEKGREEIATRKYHVPSRLRSLLVMIDGHRPLDDLLGNLGAIGVTADSIDELLRDEFITVVAGAESLGAPVNAHPRPPARPAARAVVPDVAAAALPSAASAAPADEASGADRFSALYEFYNQTIKSTIGFRGVMLQLKMEKCNTIEDFRGLRLAYLEAVQKAKGREMALSLRDRLDQLLGGRPSPDPYNPD